MALAFRRVAARATVIATHNVKIPNKRFLSYASPVAGLAPESRDIPLFHAVKDFLAQTDAAPRRPGC